MLRPLLAPRLLGLHLLAVVATAAAVLLGVWQYGAWQIHREDKAASLANVAPRPLQSVMSSDDPFPGRDVGRPVSFVGRWLPQSTVYVADRFQHGRRGFWAVTPVTVCRAGDAAAACAKAPAMLVVRGWAPSVRDVPPPPTGEVGVTGWLQPGEGSGLTDPNPDDDVIPEVRIADAIQHVDQDLYGAYVIADRVSTGSTPARTSSATRGLEKVTPASLPEAPAYTGLRNLLYAIEWWVFGGFAVFLWWRWCRDELQRQRQAEHAEPADGDPVEPQVNEVTGVPSSP
jgi:cytochrome oxidase assembly protein ShyY1